MDAATNAPLSPHDAMYGSNRMLIERRRYFLNNRNQREKIFS